MHKKQRQKKAKRLFDLDVLGFEVFLLVSFLLAGIWQPQLRQQTGALWYRGPKQMSTEWSVPRGRIHKAGQGDKPDCSEVPGTQLGPWPWLSLAHSKAPAATLPHGPERKPAKLRKLAISWTQGGTHPADTTFAGSSNSFVGSQL